MAAVALLLTGCASSGKSGVTPAEAQESLRAAGITNARVAVDDARNGFTAVRGTRISLASGTDIEASPQSLDYLFRVAWSVGESEPNTALTLRIEGESPTDTWRDAADDLRALTYEEDGRIAIEMDVSVAEEQYGPWPGPVPAPPSR